MWSVAAAVSSPAALLLRLPRGMAASLVARTFSETAAPPAAAPPAAATGAEPASSLFIANVPWAVDAAGLQAYLESLQCGPVARVRIILDKATGRPRGVAYADCSRETLARLVQMPAELEGRRLRFDVAEAARSSYPPRGAQQSGGGARTAAAPRARTENPPSQILFVGNVSYTATEEALRDALPGATGVRLALDSATGQHRGFAFAQFESVEAAVAARSAHDGVEVAGRPVYLGFAAYKEKTGEDGKTGRGDRPKRSGYGSKAADEE